MERGHEFTIELLGHGTYVVKLLERVEIEQSAGATLGRWPDFDLEAKSDDGAGVYQGLMAGLVQRIAGWPGSPGYQPFAAYVRKHGTRLADEDARARELANLQKITVRWHITDAEQYMVRLWQDRLGGMRLSRRWPLPAATAIKVARWADHVTSNGLEY